jgi:hypothetical protein
MITGHIDIEVYEINGKDFPNSDKLMRIAPHEESEASDFSGDSENFVTLEIDGTKYTVSIDELLNAVAAAKLIGQV